MNDTGNARANGPIGYFVHHQGRGHAERAAAIANALADTRKVQLFCARDDIFPDLDDRIGLSVIPSLFEADDNASPVPPALANAETPDTLHCAPVGWLSITHATGAIMQWFVEASPALFITDVSAELAQLARIASVPHMAVLQHGERDDPGHIAAYRGAMALFAPYARSLEQADRPGWMTRKTIYAPGIGVDCASLPERDVARAKLGIPADIDLVIVIGGGGGTGLPSAPLTLGARDEPDSQWVTLGKMQTEWHETPPGNLRHLGWVDNPQDWIAAADRLVSSCGNTTVHMAAAAGKPWVVVPEWRYFAEQSAKAEALDTAGVAAMARQWPGSAAAWRKLWHAAAALDPAEQKVLVDPNAAPRAAKAVDTLVNRLWSPTANDSVLTSGVSA
ncbi:hypothetical protein HME9302_01846 [Alteripontixanthobacter maritimus]|uniref:Glycosyl transferase family 28 C-terminal domain-containing protein n=1 Tax=Alteripontixanthobacter maritimus TaxID=2161824 RepID=A0A369Q843_9SPHN|nr:hypothetical protein [Alteripontixanthobacter maritimus]RDC60632.1 hypothetical protein HME9302_01846 [Alteripontixanthobacter maritimus]